MITTTFDFPDFFVFASGAPTPPADVKDYFFRTVVIERGGHRLPLQQSSEPTPSDPFLIRQPRNYMSPDQPTDGLPNPYPNNLIGPPPADPFSSHIFPDPYTHHTDAPFPEAIDPFSTHQPSADEPFGPGLPSPYEQIIDSSFAPDTLPTDIEIAAATEHLIGELKVAAYERDCNAVVGLSIAIINQAGVAVLTAQGNFASLS